MSQMREALPLEEQRAVEQTILEVPAIQPRVIRLHRFSKFWPHILFPGPLAPKALHSDL
ncbi:MAG: hypothetical protein AAGF98_00985 [Cyanobacteria bacterium P01_H01_bin.153]